MRRLVHVVEWAAAVVTILAGAWATFVTTWAKPRDHDTFWRE